MAKQLSNEDSSNTEFAFTKRQYQWLGIGLGVVALGYILMSGGASEDPEVFSEDIFNFRRITLAPTVVLIGYATIFYAILKRG